MADQTIRCAVRGAIQRGYMCGHVIIGGVFCGFDGECEHQDKSLHEGIDIIELLCGNAAGVEQ